MTESKQNPYATPDSLAQLLGINTPLLYKLSNRPQDFYRIGRIPKKNGSFRTIEAPEQPLKFIQRRILDRILTVQQPSKIATGFRPGSGIRRNAELHTGQQVVLKLDLREFFPSLKSPLVYNFFKQLGCPEECTVLLTRLCTFYGRLPQGAPTSPALSNLLLKPFDRELMNHLAEREIRLSRYADDITFSGSLSNEDITEIIRFCRRAAAGLGLKLNNRKISIRRNGGRQEVTGLVVNSETGVPRETKRLLRQQMYYLNRYWEKEFRQLDEKKLNHLLGTANFIWDLDRDNTEFSEYRRQLLEIRKYYH